jgi:uridine monophosphate synthetase
MNKSNLINITKNISDTHTDINNSRTMLIVELFKTQMIKFGEFTLKSGKKSYIYADIRTAISYPECFRSICDCYYALMDSLKYDFICGVPYSALTFASAIAYDKHIPMLLKRKEAKEYGTKKILEGVFSAGQTCLLIEDVITTGSSLLETITVLEDSGLVVKDIITLIERNQGGREILEARGYKVHSVFDLHQIINVLYDTKLITLNEKQLAVDSIFIYTKLRTVSKF